jgi:nucleotide-binding universal stress UspA family protein
MKIMVCYDYSAVSMDAVREAQKHAARWKASILVVSVVFRVEPIKHKKLHEMECLLEQEIKGLFEGVDIPYEVQLSVDDTNAGEKIVQVALRKNMDLLFIGLKKHSRVGKLFFGSTAQYVILNAPCPVITINPK